MIGLSEIKKERKRFKDSTASLNQDSGFAEFKTEDKQDLPNTMFIHREAIFSELIGLLRNKSFLKNAMQIISSKGYSDFNSFCTQEVLLAQYTKDYTLENITEASKSFETDNSDAARKSQNKKEENDSQKISAITDIILSSDSNLEIILYGLNHNIGLFVQMLYFILSCLWRSEDFNHEQIVENHRFIPFCKDKIRIKDSNKKKEPASAAYNTMKKIQSGVAPLSLKIKKHSDSGQLNSNLLLYGRIDQSIALTQKIGVLNSEISALNNKNNVLAQKLEDLNEANSALDHQISESKGELTNVERELKVCKDLLAIIQKEIINETKTKLLFFDKSKINEEISAALEAKNK